MKLRLSVVCLLVGLSAFAQSPPDDAPAGDRKRLPVESGLVERTGRRLVQLDVTVNGPRNAIAELGREQFELSVGGRKIEEFIVDNVCRLDDTPAAESGSAKLPARQRTTDPAAPAAPALRRPATYLFYFDQRHITPLGRQNALEMTRKLIDELIRDGNRAEIVSNGRELRTFADLTDDRDALLGAVDELEGDRLQWDPRVALNSEDSRRAEIVEALNEGDQSRAIGLARQYQREETWETGKNLRMFSLVLGRLADLDPPKAVIYFADTMRSNAGRHYMSFFSSRQVENEPALAAMDLDSFTAGNSFEKVIEQAAAHGIRMYTIQAQGLVAPDVSLGLSRPGTAGLTSPTLNNQNIRDAQNSLAGLALETGGRSFLNGVRTAKIADDIRRDLACLYLLSFDASALPQDQNLRTVVRVKRSKVKAQVRGRVVIQSESARLSSRLLSAFAAPGTVESDTGLEGLVIPTGFEDGKFSALVQLSVPPSLLSTTTWDLGMSLVSRGKVREDAAGRVRVNGPGIPVVFESEMRFNPGPYELITVAHETTADAVSTKRIEGEWPDPDAAPATIGPIVVLQPATAAFLRDSDLRRHGTRALAADQPARTDAPAALLGIVCRGKVRKRTLRVERRLVGASSAEFEPTDVDLSEDRCALFIDEIPSRTMTAGSFDYEVRVLEDDLELASGTHRFEADGPEETAVAGLTDAP